MTSKRRRNRGAIEVRRNTRVTARVRFPLAQRETIMSAVTSTLAVQAVSFGTYFLHLPAECPLRAQSASAIISEAPHHCWNFPEPELDSTRLALVINSIVASSS